MEQSADAGRLGRFPARFGRPAPSCRRGSYHQWEVFQGGHGAVHQSRSLRELGPREGLPLLVIEADPWITRIEFPTDACNYPLEDPFASSKTNGHIFEKPPFSRERTPTLRQDDFFLIGSF